MRLFFCITALLIVIVAQVAVYFLAGVWALFLSLPASMCVPSAACGACTHLSWSASETEAYCGPSTRVPTARATLTAAR